ncbi:rhodanese-like domain-containing protein [Massilia sp. Dwa41.01b]|uniref:rhodanese-like domain-containing protein n=1 Tax=unclassified Massilia TaxID=2609279 RepID=UPI001603304E|nr:MULTISPECIES: rhodanese-like domain-containing protein [unclassified Massilia]QNA90208.1 rhodanese-like domain-containing protein [Massilia sp. Dwa41.01b]QNB01095.1 rhodanese-like domain-containing protein [Massilia sp. Se16.2.3]
MFAMLMGLKGIAPRALHARLGRDGMTVVDVNASQSWQRARVPGAINLAPDFDAALLPPDHATPLVFYCSNPLCRKAPQAARRAEKLGYANVQVMAAGITGWVSAGLPVDSGS